MPMFANVRSMPDAIPNESGGAAFMIAALFAGKKKLVPMPLTRLTTTISHSRVVNVELGVGQEATTWRARPAVAGTTGPFRSAGRPARADGERVTKPGTRSSEAWIGDRPRGPCRYMISRKRTA